jgi:hypothetical protein
LAPTLPLALLGGIGVSRLGWLRRRRPAVWVTAMAMSVPFAFLAIAVNGSVHRGAELQLAPWLITAAGLVAIALVSSTWLEASELGAALGLAVSAGLLLLQFSLVTGLNYAGFERGGPALLSESSRPELWRVEEQARDWWRQDPTAPIKVEASLRPYLEWSLRDGPPVEWTSAAPRTAERAILGSETSANRPAGTWLRLVVAERHMIPIEPPGLSSFWRWIVQRPTSGALVRAEPYAILIAQ